MIVGTLLKYRHNGEHDDSTLVVLYDKNRNQRFLYNMDYGMRVGGWIALYAKPTGLVLTKNEIEKVMWNLYK